MRQILGILALSLLLVLQSLYAQWTIVRKDSSNSYQQIVFVDSLHGYIAGYGLLSTTDGGTSWNQTSTGDNRILRSLSIKNGFLWTSTDLGKVYLSNDSGKTLNIEFTDAAGYDFHTVCFVDSLRGWLFGNGPLGWPVDGEIILHTIDGGKSWTVQYELDEPPSESGHMQQGFFVDSLHGWAAHRYNVLHTFNGGTDWPYEFVPNDVPDLHSVFFIDTSRGWVVGDESGIRSYIIFTRDGGQSWSRGNSTIASTVRSVFFTDSTDGWISCADGTIGHSTDGGENWTIQQSNTNTSLESIFFINKQVGWAVSANGVILHTANGGGITYVPPSNEIPIAFSLSQNFPNPFNPTTRIQYSTASRSYVDIKVYNVLGQLVVTLLQDWRETGTYSVSLDGATLSSGIYICRLSAHSSNGANYIESKKMTLLH